MIVKKEEWDELQKSEKIYKDLYLEKMKTFNLQIDDLNNTIKELKKKEELNQIQVNIYKREADMNGYWRDSYNVQIEKTNIDLSQGIKNQVFRIFRKSLDYFHDEYKKKLKIKEETLSKFKSERLSLICSIEKLSYFTTRKKVIEIYNNTIGKV